ncbi:hypothetical protein F1C10_04660 [Sphingomonas sp. NBWT7]|nr:hypothetical protein F1C10_04660 [Sphingomonas sp. NBWT7]
MVRLIALVYQSISSPARSRSSRRTRRRDWRRGE